METLKLVTPAALIKQLTSQIRQLERLYDFSDTDKEKLISKIDNAYRNGTIPVNYGEMRGAIPFVVCVPLDTERVFWPENRMPRNGYFLSSAATPKDHPWLIFFIETLFLGEQPDRAFYETGCLRDEQRDKHTLTLNETYCLVYLFNDLVTENRRGVHVGATKYVIETKEEYLTIVCSQLKGETSLDLVRTEKHEFDLKFFYPRCMR